tara:strand:+ start:319 stop:1008 length:690 start_codon:yes stop_codon:yes gene_type:complete
MTSSINQVLPSLNTINRLEKDKDKEQEKLASGLRINSAADDPAGLQIASRLTAERNGAQQLSYNSQDKINQNNIQSGRLSAINEGLQRANELSIQAANPLSDNSAIQSELNQLSEQINTVASEVFGTNNFISGLDATAPAASQQAIADANDSVNNLATMSGAESNALSNQVSSYQTQVINTTSARSRIQDTDFSSTTAQQQKNELLLQSAVTSKKDEETRKGLLINQLI